LITCFLLNDKSRALIVAETAVHRTSVPEAAVAFDEEQMFGILRDRGLEIDLPISSATRT
jgi:hypothetical protein